MEGWGDGVLVRAGRGEGGAEGVVWRQSSWEGMVSSRMVLQAANTPVVRREREYEICLVFGCSADLGEKVIYRGISKYHISPPLPAYPLVPRHRRAPF